MKNKWFIASLSFFSLFACSSGGQNEAFSSAGKDSASEEHVDSFIGVVVNTEFELDGVRYLTDSESTVPFSDDCKRIGYFVNAEDLTYWTEQDKDPSLKYAVDKSNALVHRCCGVDLLNRFELYSFASSSDLGLREGDMLSIYKEMSK